MKYLFNNQYKALRRGEYVEANTEVGEFTVNSSEFASFFTQTQLEEIAKKHKFQITAKKKKDFSAKLVDLLEALKIPEVNEMTESQKAKEIIQKGLDDKMSEEDILVELITAGIRVTQAPKIYKQCLIEIGVSISPKQRREKVIEKLDKDFFPETYKEVEEFATEISSEVKDTNPRQVMWIMKKWCEKNNIEFPEKPKPVEHKIDGFSVYQSQVLGWILENRNFTKEELEEHIQSVKPKMEPEKVKAAAERFMGYVTFAEKWDLS